MTSKEAYQSFGDNIKQFLTKEYQISSAEDFCGKVDSMDVQQLQDFYDDIQRKRQAYALVEFAYKTCANAGYGSSGNAGFYFYNVALAADITGECRELTKFMWERIPQFLKEDIWERKDIWELCDFELDESKHDWLRKQVISHQSDTDSTYVTYEPFFECFTPECQQKYATDAAKVQWILDFYKKYMDKQQRQWCEELYNPRHCNNVHEFELELICKSAIGLMKKKYVKGVAFEKGHMMVDKPKLKSTGVEIVKSTTPPLIRKFMKEVVDELLYRYDPSKKDEYIYAFNERLRHWYREFRNAPIDDISQSVGVGDYKKYVISDTDVLEFEKRCPFSVKAAARYNHLAYKAGRSDLQLKTGKIKFYNIRVGKDGDYFGYPSEECPAFAPPVDYDTQWKKTFIDPVNRFLKAVSIPLISYNNCIQPSLFGDEMFEDLEEDETEEAA